MSLYFRTEFYVSIIVLADFKVGEAERNRGKGRI